MTMGRGAGRRKAIRVAATVLSSIGVLLIGEAAITVAWQEPVSAFFTARTQDRLEGEFAAEAREFAASLPEADRNRAEFDPQSQAARYARRIRTGHALGRLALPTLGRSYMMVEGTDGATLRKGPGHYAKTQIPGQGGTVAVAGHRTTYLAPFRKIDRLRRGDRITLSMPYGRFTYVVERTRIVAPTAVWVTKDVSYERLVLTACHPLYSAAQRIVVFARLARSEPPER